MTSVGRAERKSRGAPDYSGRSLWLDTLLAPIVLREQLRGELAADVVIVGAGFIGLWTAYCLALAEPTLKIVVLEAEIAGFGAAGRNAGFVSAGIAGQAQAYIGRGGWEGVQRGERAMIEGIDYIGAVVAREGIECGWTKGGSLRIATSAAQLERVHRAVENQRRRGLGETDVRLLSAAEVAARVRISGVVGAIYTPHCARVHPGRLVRGLAESCERHGVHIFERSRVGRVEPGRVQCAPESGGAAAAVRARVVVLATEAFSVDVPGRHRDYMPVFSHMLATEPLNEPTWSAIGWERCETVADQRHLFTYSQRTVDGRIALGGRGALYRMGSSIRASDERSRVHAELERTLRAWFPAAANAALTHRWGGVFAVPRDWSMSIEFDRATGIARAGGLAGHGLVASNLCGRTLADLLLERDSELTSLPWVGHRSGRWELEPARIVAQRLITAVLGSADRIEDAGRGPAGRARLAARFIPSR